MEYNYGEKMELVKNAGGPINFKNAENQKLVKNAVRWPRAATGVRFSESAREAMPRASVKSEIGEFWRQNWKCHGKCVFVASRGPTERKVGPRGI